MPKTLTTALRPSEAARIVVMKIPTAENPRMTGRAAPAATPGIRPAWASPNEVEPAMKQGRPSAVGSPSGESSAARGSLSAALASSEDVPVLIVAALCHRRTNPRYPAVAGLLLAYAAPELRRIR